VLRLAMCLRLGRLVAELAAEPVLCVTHIDLEVE
jgi:hypothetical protein